MIGSSCYRCEIPLGNRAGPPDSDSAIACGDSARYSPHFVRRLFDKLRQIRAIITAGHAVNGHVYP